MDNNNNSIYDSSNNNCYIDNNNNNDNSIQRCPKTFPIQVHYHAIHHKCLGEFMMAIFFDNISLLTSYKEKEDIVMYRVVVKEIKEAFPELIHCKKQRNKRKRKCKFDLRYHPSKRHYFRIYIKPLKVKD